MHEYEIELTTKDGRRITDSIRATSKFDAERVIKDRYPGCSIWHTRQVD